MPKLGQSKYKDIKGKIIGHYTVLDVKTNKAIIQCECGSAPKTVELWYAATSGRKCKECGNHRSGELNSNFKGYKGLYTNWITFLNKKNLLMGFEKTDLTMEYLWELYINQNKKCALSNLELNQYIKYIDEKNRSRVTRTASLDRIDSSQAYKIGNVQWVHKDVNIMKNAFDQSYFIQICKLISSNINEIV